MDTWHAHFSNLFEADNSENKTGDDIEYAEYSLVVEEFSICETRQAIYCILKYHKASGPDGISNEILKWGLEWLQFPIFRLVNQLWKNNGPNFME